MRVIRFAMALMLIGGPAAAQAPAPPSPVAPPEAYRGALMTLDQPSGAVVDLLRVIADVGGISIVTVGVAPYARIAIRAVAEPWDQVLDRVVLAAGLVWVRRGPAYIVGTPAALAPLTAGKPRRYRGQAISVDLVDVDAASAARLLAVAGDAPFELAPSTATVRLRVRNVPLALARHLLELHAGAAPVARPARVPAIRRGTCAAADAAPGSLALRGILQRGAKRHALLVAGGTPHVVTTGACVGAERAKVTAITASSIELSGGTTSATLQLGAPATPPAEQFGVGGLGLGPGTTVPSGGIGRIGIGAVGARGTLALQAPATSPGLPAEVIRRVVHRNINRLRYCYEKELARTPALAGAVTLAFTIAPDGSVSAATARGLGDEVGGCLVAAIRSLAFPAPERGLTVNVSYPMRGTPAPARAK